MGVTIPLCIVLVGIGGFAISRWPWLCLVPVAYRVLTMPRTPEGPVMVIGPFNIFISDIAAVLFVIAGLIRYRQARKRLIGQGWLLSLLFALILASLARGIVDIGLSTAVVESRDLLWLIAAVFFSLTVSWNSESMQRILMIFSIILGIALVALGACNAMRYGIGGASSGIYVDGLFESSRILNAPQALLLGLCVLFLFASSPIARKKTIFLLIGVFVLVLLVSQQRTAWTAIAIGAGVLIINRGAGNWGKAASILAIASWLGLLVLVSGAFDSTIESLLKSASDSSTFNARTESWGQLLSSNYDSGLENIIFGAPFGSGFSRTLPTGLSLGLSPHNFYVLLLLRIGFLGVSLLLLFIGRLVWRLRDGASIGRLALLISVLVFSITYSPSWMLLPFLGWILVQEREPGDGLWSPTSFPIATARAPEAA